MTGNTPETSNDFSTAATHIAGNPVLADKTDMTAMSLDPASLSRLCVTVGEVLQYCGFLASNTLPAGQTAKPAMLTT